MSLCRCSPQKGHPASTPVHLDSMIALLQMSFDFKYVRRETRLSDMLKSIIVLHKGLPLYAKVQIRFEIEKSPDTKNQQILRSLLRFQAKFYINALV